RQPAAPFAFEPMAAHKDIAGHIDPDVERRRKRRWLVRGNGRRLSGLAFSLDDLEHNDVGREAFREGDVGAIDGEGCRNLRRGQGTSDRYLPGRRGDRLVARGDTEIV